MKNKFNNFVVIILSLFAIANSAIAQCSVNGQETPCNIVWAQYGLFIAIPFIVIGLFLLIKPNWVISYQIWSQKLFRIKNIPGKMLSNIQIRIMGLVFLILGLVFLYFAIY